MHSTTETCVCAIFQHDNAQAHTARVYVDFLYCNNLAVLEWPDLSTNLSPIRWLWYNTVHHQSEGPQQQNLYQLAAALLRE